MRTAGDDARILPHVIGDISAYDGDAPAPVDLDAIIARCPTRHSACCEAAREISILSTSGLGGKISGQFASAGARRCLIWRWIRSLRRTWSTTSSTRRCSTTRLPELSGLSPASILTPISMCLSAYGRLRLFDRMPQRFFSHVRLRPEFGQRRGLFRRHADGR